MAIKARETRIDVLQGTLDMLILQILQWGATPRSQQGWLAAEWKTSDKGQRAKYYRLTHAGKKQLVAEQSKWKTILKAIRLVMRPTEE